MRVFRFSQSRTNYIVAERRAVHGALVRVRKNGPPEWLGSDAACDEQYNRREIAAGRSPCCSEVPPDSDEYRRVMAAHAALLIKGCGR